MSHLPITDAAIRAWRALDYAPSARWVKWAVEQLVAGRDGGNLRILAGLTEPFDTFDTKRFTDNALAEVGVEPLTQNAAILSYAQELVATLIERPTLTAEVLSELAALCVDAGYPKLLMPFYLLHFARQDLQSSAEQHYWDGAGRLEYRLNCRQRSSPLAN